MLSEWIREFRSQLVGQDQRHRPPVGHGERQLSLRLGSAARDGVDVARDLTAHRGIRGTLVARAERRQVRGHVHHHPRGRPERAEIAPEPFSQLAKIVTPFAKRLR